MLQLSTIMKLLNNIKTVDWRLISFLFVTSSFFLIFNAPDAYALERLKVQLLFPLELGTELDAVATIANQPKIVSIKGRSFVLVGEFYDAKIAYRVGVSMQKRLGLPFEIAYDPGHPQSDFLWFKDMAAAPQNRQNSNTIVKSDQLPKQSTAANFTAAPKIAKNRKSDSALRPQSSSTVPRSDLSSSSKNQKSSHITLPNSNSSKQPSISLRADALGLPDLRLHNNSMLEAKLSPLALKVESQDNSSLTADNALFDHPGAAEVSSSVTSNANQPSALSLNLKISPIPPKPALGVVSAVKLASSPLVKLLNKSNQTSPLQKTNAPVLKPLAAAVPIVTKRERSPRNSSKSLDIKARLAVPLVSSIPKPLQLKPLPKIETNTVVETLLSSVKKGHSSVDIGHSIDAPAQPVAIEDMTMQALTVPSLFAVNPDLIYLYVLVRSPADLKILRAMTPISSLNLVDGKLLAQVAVFSSNQTGRRLLDLKQQQLSGMGLTMHLVGKGFAALASSRADSSDSIGMLK